MHYDHLVHNCTAVGCNFSFKTVGLNSAHAQLFLHALKIRNTKISFACHKNCIYKLDENEPITVEAIGS